MKRRALITLLGSAVIATPLGANAQRSTEVRRVAFSPMDFLSIETDFTNAAGLLEIKMHLPDIWLFGPAFVLTKLEYLILNHLRLYGLRTALWCLRRRLLLQRQRGTIKSPVEEAG